MGEKKMTGRRREKKRWIFFFFDRRRKEKSSQMKDWKAGGGKGGRNGGSKEAEVKGEGGREGLERRGKKTYLAFGSWFRRGRKERFITLNLT